MNTVLISIISEQTIPNVLFIKEKMHLASEFLFITTRLMENKKKTQAILNTVRIPEEITHRLIITDNKTAETIQQLKQHISSYHHKTFFLVNLTGGTKMMALAVFLLFRKHNSSFYYLPIGQNSILKIQGDLSEKKSPLKTRLNIAEYLIANGISYSRKTEFTFDKKSCYIIFKAYKDASFNFSDFPVKMATKLAHLNIHEANIRGEWFEEFTYYIIKEQLNLDQKNIASSVMIYKNKQVKYNDNEFDLMFTSDNELFVVECKDHLGEKNMPANMDKTLYKLGAINKNFGLKTNSFVFTLSDLRNPLGQYSPKIIRKCEILNIHLPIDKTVFENELNMSKLIKTK